MNVSSSDGWDAVLQQYGWAALGAVQRFGTDTLLSAWTLVFGTVCTIVYAVFDKKVMEMGKSLQKWLGMRAHSRLLCLV